MASSMTSMKPSFCGAMKKTLNMVRKKKKEEKEAKEENIERVRAHKISMFENVLLYFEL